MTSRLRLITAFSPRRFASSIPSVHRARLEIGIPTTSKRWHARSEMTNWNATHLASVATDGPAQGLSELPTHNY